MNSYNFIHEFIIAHLVAGLPLLLRTGPQRRAVFDMSLE